MALICACPAQDVPQWIRDCQPKTRSGGVKILGFSKCDFVHPDITDPAQWTTAQTANNIHVTPIGVGSKPSTDKTTEILDSCGTETVVSETHTIEFKFYGIDDTNLTDFDIMNTIKQNLASYTMFFVDCNDLFYIADDFATGSIGYKVSESAIEYIIPETSDESAYYTINLTFKYRGIVTGRKLPGVLEVLN